MLIYARSDTSFLLYIYDKLVSELADAQTIDGIVPLARVAQLSAATAKRVHLPVPPEYDMRWSQLLSKWQKTHEWPPSSKSYKAFRAMYDWRDRVAREMDESPFYILNNAALLALAQHPPRNSHAASALLRASPIGRARVDELVALIAALDGQECPPMPAALEPAQAVPVVVPPIIGAPKRDLWLNPEADGAFVSCN
jgi:exosome complex exonuclease RRP6